MKIAQLLASAKVENLPSLSTGQVPWYLFHGLAAFAAAITGFFFVKPRTLYEAGMRLVVTLIFSFVFGPLLVVAAHHYLPWAFESARLYSPNLGDMYLTGPIYVFAGLPAWWILGWVIRSLEKRKDADIKDIIAEVRGIKSGKE